MNTYTKTEKRLFEKLLRVEKGEEVSLTPEEAAIYRVEAMDLLPEEDLNAEPDQ